MAIAYAIYVENCNEEQHLLSDDSILIKGNFVVRGFSGIPPAEEYEHLVLYFSLNRAKETCSLLKDLSNFTHPDSPISTYPYKIKLTNEQVQMVMKKPYTFQSELEE